MKCEQCGKEFEAKRVDAKYCSSTCRSKAIRATDNLQQINATDNSQSERHIKTKEECLAEGILERHFDKVEDKRFYTHLTKDKRYICLSLMGGCKLNLGEAINEML